MGTTIAETKGVSPKKGEVGLEIEVEGRRLPHIVEHWWNVVGDGSLRNDGVEYVFKKPFVRDSCLKALQHLQRTFDRCDARPDFSQRTSVHVHINIMDMTMYDVLKFSALYYIFEESLIKNFKEHRQGNNFCLRLKDATAPVNIFKEWIISGRSDNMHENSWKYGALNMYTVEKFGSLEFRSMHGNLDPTYINEWVGVLLAIKDASLRFKDIEEILMTSSMEGWPRFTRLILGEDLEHWVTGTEDWVRTCMDGVWRIQPIGFVSPSDVVENDTPDQQLLVGVEVGVEAGYRHQHTVMYSRNSSGLRRGQ